MRVRSARWLHAAKDDVSSQASGGEPPPAPQGSPRPSDPLFGSIPGWLAAPGAGMLAIARGVLSLMVPPRGDTQPRLRGQGCSPGSSGQGGWAAVAAEDGCCTMCKPPASYQRRLEGRSGKKMIKTISFFFNNKKKSPGKKPRRVLAREQSL